MQVPVNGRIIPIIGDALLADKELGTGAVKVTPAHDPNDYACGLRNDLPMINILNPDASINEEGGEFEGLGRYDAREAIVAKMKQLGHFEGVEDRRIPVKHSDRSKTPIEPYLSDQWFVKMDTLAQSAMDAVSDNRVKIFPQRYTKTYMDWLGEKRDWCISRQLWWGHRIPVYYKDGETQASIRPPEEFDGWKQDPDTLDTWFSSALWTWSTLIDPELAKNYSLSLEDLLERSDADESLGRMKVLAVLESLPRLGKVKARRTMEDIGISETRRLRGLGAQQRALLLSRFAIKRDT